MATLLKSTKDEENTLVEEVELHKRSIEENEAEYEAKTKELEIIYETYLEALQIKKDLINLKSQKQDALEKGRARAAE